MMGPASTSSVVHAGSFIAQSASVYHVEYPFKGASVSDALCGTGIETTAMTRAAMAAMRSANMVGLL